jgi:predicted nucleic acid-binding protein
MRYGIDAATLLLIASGDVVVDAGNSLVAPHRVLPDLLQLLLAEVRSGSRDEKDALAIHTRATETKIRLLGDRVSRRTAWSLAREHGWSELRDAEYLAVTMLQADALATADRRLMQAAATIVPVVPPAALSAS